MTTESTMPDIDVARWATCEREALHGPDRMRSSAVHVGALVAQGVWRALADEHTETLELPYDAVTFDAVTPRLDDATRAAALMSEEADRVLRKRFDGYGVMEGARHALLGYESTQNYDDNHVETLIHLRIGQFVGHSWLRLGQHLDEWAVSDRPEYGAVVHVPRMRIDRDVRAGVEVRAATELVDEWVLWAKHVEAVLESRTSVLARPGRHCGQCRVACGVRP